MYLRRGGGGLLNLANASLIAKRERNRLDLQFTTSCFVPG